MKDAPLPSIEEMMTNYLTKRRAVNALGTWMYTLRTQGRTEPIVHEATPEEMEDAHRRAVEKLKNGTW